MNKGLFSLPAAVWACLLVAIMGGCKADLWLTPDQQGQRLMQQAQYAEAAAAFGDVFHSGVAHYRAGAFEAASAAFAQLDTDTAHFNRGNSLVLSGKYQEAVEAYERALELQPAWPAAVQNREIARIRAERLKAEGGKGTGGQLGADDVVFGEKGQNKPGESQTVALNDTQAVSDEQMRALWLRRVQTQPADFLRAKFAYQRSVAK